MTKQLNCGQVLTKPFRNQVVLNWGNGFTHSKGDTLREKMAPIVLCFSYLSSNWFEEITL